MGILKNSQLMVGITAVCIALSGCSTPNNQELNSTVQDFAIGVKIVTDAIENSFRYVEIIHTQAQTDQITLQYALGGTPDFNFTTLFSQQDLAARMAVLTGLNAYSDRLLSVTNRKILSSVVASVNSAAIELSKISMGKFDITHSLNNAEGKVVKSSRSGFVNMLIEPEKVLRLSHLVKKAEPYFHKMAVLIYVDLGSSIDQSQACQFDTPTQPSSLNLHSLKLCEGGLRSVSHHAFEDDITALKAYISTLKDTSKTSQNKKNTSIYDMLFRQKQEKKFDTYMAQIQESLVLMVDAHADLAELFVVKNQVRSTSIASFLREAQQLSSYAPDADIENSQSGNPDNNVNSVSPASDISTMSPVSQTQSKIQSIETAITKLDVLLSKNPPLSQLKSTLRSRSKLAEELESMNAALIKNRNIDFDQVTTNLSDVKNDLVKLKQWLQTAEAATSWAAGIIRAISAVIAFI